jgi:hypothetical protein
MLGVYDPMSIAEAPRLPLSPAAAVPFGEDWREETWCAGVHARQASRKLAYRRIFPSRAGGGNARIVHLMLVIEPLAKLTRERLDLAEVGQACPTSDISSGSFE